MEIALNLRSLLSTIPPHIKVVAVSKTRTISEMMEAYQAGQRAFGENKVQEMSVKASIMPADTEWHFIGHLQTNKVKYIAPFVRLIHSVDSLKLLHAINREAGRCHRIIDCLFQFHIASEETKFGLDDHEAHAILNDPSFKTFESIRMTGVMGMATYTEDTEKVRREFKALKHHFDDLQHHYFSEEPGFKEISMGMTSDYEIAVGEGSTIIRVGTLLFGDR